MSDTRDRQDASIAIPQTPALAELVYEALRVQIVSGGFGPGDDLVIEHLAAELNVSATPVREAVARLLHDGVVQKVTGGRLKLRELTLPYVNDTFQVRIALEGLGAELAASQSSEEKLDGLRQHLQRICDSLDRGEYEEYVSADDAFHEAIVQMSGNDVLLTIYPSIQFQAAFIRRSTQPYFQPFSRVIIEEHCTIFDAIKHHDAPAARLAMESHIRRSAERNTQVLGL